MKYVLIIDGEFVKDPSTNDVKIYNNIYETFDEVHNRGISIIDDSRYEALSYDHYVKHYATRNETIK